MDITTVNNTIIENRVRLSENSQSLYTIADKWGAIREITHSDVEHWLLYQTEGGNFEWVKLYSHELGNLLQQAYNMKNLERLFLDAYSIGVPRLFMNQWPESLQSVYLHCPEWLDLRSLNRLHKCKRLTLHSAPVKLREITEILSNLEYFACIGVDTTDVPEFGNLLSLTTHCASGNSIVAHAPNLQHFSAKQWQEWDFTMLNKCPKLEQIQVIGDSIVSTRGLERTQVKRMVISSQQLQDCNSLAGLPIELLEIRNAPLLDFEFLTALSDLEELSLENCVLADVAPIVCCSNLKSLKIYNFQTMDLRPLAEMEHLENVTIGGAYDSIDFMPLLAAEQIKRVYMKSNLCSEIHADKSIPAEQRNKAIPLS